MTLEEIKQAKPELRDRLASAFKSKDAQLLISAIEEDILDGITRKPIIEAGETADAALARWHTFLAGRRDVLKIIKEINKPQSIKPTVDERPFESAIPQHLVEARKRDFKPPTK